MDTFVKVILPLRLPWIPFYRTSAPLRRGTKVRVVCSGKEYIGVVWQCDVQPQVDSSKVLDVLEVMDDLPPVSEAELQLWEFVADYYMCTLGEVFKTAYSSGKINSERSAAASLALKEERERLTLEKMSLTLSSRREKLLSRLARIEADLEKPHNERVRARLESQKESVLADVYSAEEAIAALKLKKRQFSEDTVRRHRHGSAAVQSSGRTEKPLLLVGTGRIPRYLELVRSTLSEGLDVLLLTADIIFSNRLESVLRGEFPDLMVVNSRQTLPSRRKCADLLRNSSGNLVLGTRSAIFMPFTKLGLVIIDEEQDPSYKQEDPAPRYNGRDCALKLAQIHGARVVLGSACPSLESIHNCDTAKYVCENLGGTLAPVELIDVSAERRKRGMIGNFSRKLIAAISSTPGRVTLIRGWEKPLELEREVNDLFPTRDIRVLTLKEAKSEGLADDALVAILQADALVHSDDFRADERAIQIVVSLACSCRRLVVQTAVPERFDGSRSSSSLMEERRQFSFPPFTRLVQVRDHASGAVLRQHFLGKSASLQSEKRAIQDSIGANEVIDVDPA